MGNLIRGEFYKLKKSKYFIGMMFISAAFSPFPIKCWYSDAYRNPQLLHGINSIYYAFIVIMFSSIIFAVLAGDFIVKDFKSSNISKSFIYGYRRKKVILSKLIVFIIFSLFLELIYSIILVAYASSKYGFCEVLDFNAILYLIRITGAGIMFNIASISIIGMIAIITKSTYFTFASPVVLYLGCILGDFVLGWQLPFLKIILIHPYIAGAAAMERIASKTDIIAGIISIILIFIITIVGGIFYMNNADIN